MRIRLDQELPPRFVAALRFFALAFVCGLLIALLVDSGRRWASIYLAKHIARLHLHYRAQPYTDFLPPHESIRYDPVDRKYKFHYDKLWHGYVDVYDDGRVFVPGVPSH